MLKTLPLLASCFFCALLVSCSSSTQPTNSATPWAANTQTYKVTYRDNTVLIDQPSLGVIHAADTLAAGDPDSVYLNYHLDKSSTLAKSLTAGQIMLIYGQSVRRIDSVVTTDTDIIAYTSDANLTDAIADGTVGWDYGFDYNASVTHPSIIIPKTGQRIPMMQTGSNSFKVGFPVGDYNGTIEMTLNGDNAAVTVTLSKSLGSAVKAKLTCAGTLERFRQKSDLRIAAHALQNFHHKNEGMKGDLTLTATVAGSGSDALGGIDLPIVLLEVPYLVGPILVQMKVSCKFVVNLVVPVDGSADLSTHFTYNSDVGFKYEGTSVEANAQIGDWKMEKNKADIGASTAIGVNFGMDLPKLSLDIMHKSVVLYAQTGILTNGDFSFNPACLRAQGVYVGSIGYNLSFLGLLDIGKGSMTLWNEKKVFIQSGTCN